MSPPKRLKRGIITSQPKIPPANIYEEILIPHIYPTPKSAGRTSTPNPPPLYLLCSK